MSDQSISLSDYSTAKDRRTANESKMKLSHFLQASFDNVDMESSQILEGVSCHSNDPEAGKFSLQNVSQKADLVRGLLEQNIRNYHKISESLKAIVEKRQLKNDGSGFYREQTQKLIAEQQNLNQILLEKYESQRREYENLSHRIAEIRESSHLGDNKIRNYNDQGNHIITDMQVLELTVRDFGKACNEFYDETRNESEQSLNINSIVKKMSTFRERVSEIVISAHNLNVPNQSDENESCKELRENSYQVQEKAVSREAGDCEKSVNPGTIYYSVEQPINLSYHIYLEALQEKINEVNELKHALMEVAVFATNDKIKRKLKGLNLQNPIKEYKNKYLASSVECIKETITNEGSVQRAEQLAQALVREKNINNEILQRYKSEMWERRNLHNKLEDLKGTIRVYCRIRPTLLSENIPQISLGESYISYPETNSVRFFSAMTQRGNVFEFDKVFAGHNDQQHVFEELTPLVTSVLDGFNVCIMAYGQTGSGKTYTMEGRSNVRGMVQLSLEQIFEIIREKSKEVDYSVSLSMLEVYNEQIRDLLQGNPEKAKLDIREVDNIVTLHPKSTVIDITSYDEAEEIINKGRINRKKAATSINALSSRSHCIVTINVVANNHILNKSFVGKLHMIDLAGSERIYKSESEGERLKEACNINQSLTTLGKVLNNLAIKSSHIPYRESKLTHLLKDSLGGAAKTLLIIQCSPNPNDLNESISTLQFGARVSKVEKGKAKQNTTDLWNENSLKSSEIIAQVNLKEVTSRLSKHKKTESLIKLEKFEKENYNTTGSSRLTKSPRVIQTKSFVYPDESGTKTIPRNTSSESVESVSVAITAFNKTKEPHHLKNSSSQVSLTPVRRVDMQTTIEPLQLNLDRTAKKKAYK